MGKRRAGEREEPCAICGHYHDYLGGEACKVCGHCLVPTSDAKPAMPSSLPTEVLPGFLFLGSYDHASRAELLKALGIGHILNTVPNCQNLYKNSFDYYTVSASPPPLEECFQVIERVRAEGEKVLVHCMSGASRSPTVVIYYLMRHRGWRLSEAYSWVKDRRPSIAITAGDAERLQQAEVQLLGPAASHFQVPVSAKGAGNGAGGGPGGAALGGGPFSWPAGGIAMRADAGGVPAVCFNPQQEATLNFAAAAAAQQQQHQAGAAAGGGFGGTGGGGFVFGAPPQQQGRHDTMLD